MKWHGARQRPLQTLGTVPRLRVGPYLPRPAVGRQRYPEQEVDLQKTEAERADRRDLVEVRELRRVVGIASRHAGKSQKMHGKERDVEEDHRSPEMNLSAQFVVHIAGPFRHPVVPACKDTKE